MSVGEVVSEWVGGYVSVCMSGEGVSVSVCVCVLGVSVCQSCVCMCVFIRGCWCVGIWVGS